MVAHVESTPWSTTWSCEVIASLDSDDDISSLLPEVGDAPVFTFDKVSSLSLDERSSDPPVLKRARKCDPEHDFRTAGIYTYCSKCGAYSGGNRPLRPGCDRVPRNDSAARALGFLNDHRHRKKGYSLH